MIQHGHDVPGAGMLVNHVVNLAVNPAVNRMDESVAPARFGILEECAA